MAKKLTVDEGSNIDFKIFDLVDDGIKEIELALAMCDHITSPMQFAAEERLEELRKKRAQITKDKK